MNAISRRALGALPLLAFPALAQPAWPERPIRWVVGFPPAGTADILSLLLGEQVS